MSADDILDRATRALRERTDGASSDAGRTRTRVIALSAQRGKQRRLATTILPLAAVLAVSSAWADTHGWFAGVWEQVESSLGAPATGVTPRAAVATSVASLDPPPAPAAPTIPTVSIDSLPREQTPTSTSTSTSTPTSTSTSTSTPTPTSTPTSATTPPSPPEDPSAPLYAAAHRAHFVDHDPSAALRAWDAYLLAAPDGPFAPEAHYNRAITLVRLHRLDEARRALAPFADGGYGTYRAREAREILDALGDE